MSEDLYKVGFTEEEKVWLGYCTFCPKLCRHLCPVAVATAKETLIPSAKVTILRLLEKKELAPGEELLEIFYACSACRRCTNYCVHGVDVSRLLSKGRALISSAGFAHQSLNRIRTAFARSGNRYDQKTSARLFELVPEEKRYDPSLEQDVLLFFDPETILFEPQLISVVITLVETFTSRQVKVFCGPESSTGLALLWSGNYGDYVDQFKRTIAALARTQTVITTSDELIASVRQWREYLGIPFSPELLHLSEFLATKIRSDKEKISALNQSLLPKGVYYYDEPLLAQWGGVYNEPRELLSLLLGDQKLCEFSRNREEAFSSGYGGLCDLTMPDEAFFMRNELLSEMAQNPAWVVVQSVACAQNLKKEPISGVEVKNLFMLLFESLKRA